MELLEYSKDCVQRLLRRIVESIAHTNNQSGISEGNDIHLWNDIVTAAQKRCEDASHSKAPRCETGEKCSLLFASALGVRTRPRVAFRFRLAHVHSARFASISMLIATVWLIPETDSAAGANIRLKSRRVIGSVVTDQRIRVVSLSGVSSFT